MEKIKSIKQRTLKQNIPYILLIGGIIGVICAAILTSDKIEMLSNSSFRPNCNLNPIFSCTTVINSSEAEAFGFPNPYLGMIGFAILATVGAAMLAGARFKRWFWLATFGGIAFATAFVHWLIFKALYEIGSLCLYCLVVWSVTIPMFWYTWLYLLREKHIKTPKKFKKTADFIQKHHGDILIVWFLIIIALILKRFWYYWSTLI